jgi:hypothetical protein
MSEKSLQKKQLRSLNIYTLHKVRMCLPSTMGTNLLWYMLALKDLEGGGNIHRQGFQSDFNRNYQFWFLHI